MLAFLPLISLLAMFIFISQRRPAWSFGTRVTRSIMLVGGFSVLMIEGLSLFNGITRNGLLISWIALLVITIIGIIRNGKRANIREDLSALRPGSTLEWMATAVVCLVLIITAIVAFITPPQTWDVLNYHMSRVAHWAQNQSVDHFATGIEIQNSIPPGAEYGLLQLYVLSQGDQFVHLLQWLSMVGSLIAIGEIARRLGANRTGIYLSVLLAATMPLGIVQSSSAMSEYVLTLWILCAVVEVQNLADQPDKPGTWFFLGLAAGLAILTKPHAFPYLLPLAIYALFILIRTRSFSIVVRSSFTAIFLVVLINGAFIYRTVNTYGSPFSGDQVSRHANAEISVRTLISNTLRNAALHAGTPSPYVNKAIYLAIEQVHHWIGMDINEPTISSFGNFKVFKPITNEVTISNPLHAWLLLIAFFYLGFKPKSITGQARILILLALTAYGLISLVFRWQIFGGRFQLAFFSMLMPVLGMCISKKLPARWLWGVTFIFLICALPWLFSIQSRPLLPTEESFSESILTADREALYYANGLYLQTPYKEMTALIKNARCSTVGISLTGGAAEYPLWILLGAPREKLQIEWLVAGTPSEKYAPDNYTPCAVICDSCPDDWNEVKGLPMQYKKGPYALYLQE